MPPYAGIGRVAEVIMGGGGRKKRLVSWKARGLGTLFLCVGGAAAYCVWLEQWHWLVIAASVLIGLLVFLVHRRRRRFRSMRAIDAMGGHEFEQYLVELFTKLGYTARNTGEGGHDFGADLIVEKDGVKTAVQAKHHEQRAVGNDAVQQAIAGATYYACDEAMVVTNSRYTSSARKQAAGCHHFSVHLWSRADLIEILKKKR